MKYIAVLIFGLMVLLGTAGAVYDGYNFFDLRIRGVKAHAEVVSISSSRMVGVQNGHSYTSVRKVAFVMADGTPVIHEFKDEFSGVEAGDKVSVFYNPADPREVIPGTFFTLGLSLAMATMALLSLMMIVTIWRD